MVEIVEQRTGLVINFRARIARSHHHEEWQLARRPSEVPERSGRRCRGPVGVLDDEHRRPIRCRRFQVGADRLQQLGLLGLPIDQPVTATPRRFGLGEQPFESVDGASPPTSVVAWGATEVLSERLHERPESGGLVLVAGTEEHVGTRRLGRDREVGRQPALPDPGLPREHRHDDLTAPRPVPQPFERSPLTGATHQRRRLDGEVDRRRDRQRGRPTVDRPGPGQIGKRPPAVDAQLAHEGRDVALDCSLRHEQRQRNLVVRQSVADELEDLSLAPRDPHAHAVHPYILSRPEAAGLQTR